MNTELLSLLTREGVLLAVSVRYWRGCKKLRAEDLGLNADDVSDRLISLGHKRLLPRDATAALALIEGRTHAFVEANTFPFLGGLAHFLPNPRLDDVTTRLHELETGFWAAKADFLQRYASCGNPQPPSGGPWPASSSRTRTSWSPPSSSQARQKLK